MNGVCSSQGSCGLRRRPVPLLGSCWLSLSRSAQTPVVLLQEKRDYFVSTNVSLAQGARRASCEHPREESGFVSEPSCGRFRSLVGSC